MAIPYGDAPGPVSDLISSIQGIATPQAARNDRIFVFQTAIYRSFFLKLMTLP